MSLSMIGILVNAAWQTLLMVGVSCFFAVLLGMPLGVLLFATRRYQILSSPIINKIVGAVANIIRSIPFIILMVAITPLTHFIIGSSIGTQAAIVPLVISAIPFIARLIEASLSEVSSGLVEAASAMGATPRQIIMRVLLPEAMPSIVRNITLTLITLVGYSAMAGAVGGGGLGDVAIQYGYQRFLPSVTFVTVALLVVLVQLLQWLGDFIARRLAHVK